MLFKKKRQKLLKLNDICWEETGKAKDTDEDIIVAVLRKGKLSIDKLALTSSDYDTSCFKLAMAVKKHLERFYGDGYLAIKSMTIVNANIVIPNADKNFNIIFNHRAN